jgi:microcystin-dependent protein
MSDPFIGEIRMFGGNFAPVGWLLCQGQTLPIALYDTLFNLIGTTYGGDGQETFQLPNLQSRLPVHQGSGYVLGQTGGAETVTLTPQQMPLHSHAATAATSGAGAAGPAGNVWRDFGRPVYSTAAPNAAMNAGALQAAGGGQPHDNLPPYLVINFIIATEGIYPPPN